MKSIFQYECKKVVGQTFFWKFFCSIFALNLILVGLSITSSMQNQGNYHEQVMSEMLANELYHQDEINTFHKTLSSRIEESKTLQESSLFQKNEGFDEQYLDLKINKLMQLQTLDMTYQDVRGADVFFQSEVTYFLFLLMCLVIGSLVFVQEEEHGTLSYLRTMSNDYQVMLYKLCCAILLSAGSGFILFLSNYMTGLLVYGGWDWNTPILQLKGMIDSVHHMTLFQYLLFFILSILLFIILIQCLISYLSYQSKNNFLVLGIVVFIFVVEMIFYYSIKDDSYLVWLKEWNLWMFLLSLPLFQNFRSVGILNHLDLYIVILVVIVLMMIVFFGSSCYAFRHGKQVKYSKIPRWKNTKVYSLGIYEGYKIFWNQKAFVIILLFGCFTLSQIKDFNPFIDTDHYYYRIYAKHIESLNDDEIETYVIQQNKYYEDIHNQITHLNEQKQLGSISDAKFELEISPLRKALYSEQGWQKTYEQYQWVKTNNEVMVEEYGYQYFFEHVNQEGVIWFGLSIIILAYILHNVMGIENKVSPLLDTSVHKQKKINQWKYFYAFVCATLCYLFGFGMYLYVMINHFNLSMFHAPLSSLKFLNIDNNIQIGIVIMMIILVRYFIMLIYTCICLNISKKCGNSGKALLTCIFVAILILMIYLWIL